MYYQLFLFLFLLKTQGTSKTCWYVKKPLVISVEVVAEW